MEVAGGEENQSDCKYMKIHDKICEKNIWTNLWTKSVKKYINKLWYRRKSLWKKSEKKSILQEVNKLLKPPCIANQ